MGEWVELDGEVAITARLPSGPTTLLNIIARKGTVVGRGASPVPVRFIFALAATGDLERWHARVFDPPERVSGDAIVWIA